VSGFDPRIVPPSRLAIVRTVQQRVSCRLGGGAALSGIHLRHRLSRDLDLFFDREDSVRDVVRVLPDLARATGATLAVARDARSHVRVNASDASGAFEIDLVYDATHPIEQPATTADVIVESFIDLRASKLACLVERSEPRDLVDVMFLERAGFRVEDELPLAVRKDAGVDPGVLAWLLRDFPTAPEPEMLTPIAPGELERYRDELAERLRSFTMAPK
jgi:hypothetical protein